MTANPTWYEILGVEPSASPTEIKKAWQAATDAYAPGTGAAQLRLFNNAAEVLLDPERRAAYDASLGLGTATGDAVGGEEPEESEDSAAPAVPDQDAAPEEPAEESDEPGSEPVLAGAGPAAPDMPADLPPQVPGRRGLVGALAAGGLWVLIPTLLLTIASVTLAVVLVRDIQGRVNQAQDGAEAAATAERAMSAVLAYDYRHMDADLQRAEQYLTPSYAQEFAKTFGLLTEGADGKPGPAVQTKTVVTADALDVGVQDAEPGRVRVLLFVNQTSVKDGASPAIFQNRVVATMVQRDGAWLIDGLQSL